MHRKTLTQNHDGLAGLAGDLLENYARPWLEAQGRTRLRLALPFLVLLLAWWVAATVLPVVSLVALITYALANLVLLGTISYSRYADPGLEMRLLVSLAASDTIMAVVMLLAAGPLTPAIVPIYIVMVIKALRYRQQFLWLLLTPILLGPLYLSALAFRNYNLALLDLPGMITFWFLVGGSLASFLFLLFLSERRLLASRRLSYQLETSRSETQARMLELESINNDLRARIRSQQALEESLRAITGSLSLDDVLRQILDSTAHMLGTPPVAAAALTLVRGQEYTHHLLPLDIEPPATWAESLAREVVAQRQPLLVGDTLEMAEQRDLYRHKIVSALSTPLIDAEGVVRGALTVASTQRHAFTSADIRHLNSFAIQATIAISNAELHSQMARQQIMLEAILRDIDDGLVVLDEAGNLVLANPMGYRALITSDSLGGNLRTLLSQLAYDVQITRGDSLSRDLSITARDEHGETSEEHFYRAFASLVRISEHDPSHTAIVLHDVTHDKLEERERTEFISMVSHELRNPLQTLNGFLKVVLQGKAGQLNELQREFLELADMKAELLKSRIRELLEYNRLEGGRLRLQPKWTDLRQLLMDTGAQLQLQAEQMGLELHYTAPPDLPLLLMDRERIGQVLTNLIENAIKATPRGGSIKVGAQIYDNHIEVYVSDTGVGIPENQRERIFRRFYRLNQHESGFGGNLGLGLSICQQIVEGHNGHIRVESEEGCGSTFSFTLPLVAREQTIEMELVS